LEGNNIPPRRPGVGAEKGIFRHSQVGAMIRVVVGNSRISFNRWVKFKFCGRKKGSKNKKVKQE
jgi:hypothetical protein